LDIFKYLLHLLGFFIILFFLGCGDKNKSNQEKFEVEFAKLNSIATNRDLSYSIRKQNNLKAEVFLGLERNDSLYRTQLEAVAYNYFVLYDLDNFKRTTKILYAKALAEKDSLSIATALRFFGIYYRDTSKNDSAFYYYIKAENIYKSLNESENLCKVLYGKGLVKYYENDFLGSETELIKSLKISKANNLYNNTYTAYVLLALNSFAMDQYDNALSYSKRAIKLGEDNHVDSEAECNSIIMNSMGSTYLKLNKVDSAIYYFQKGITGTNLLTREPQTYCYLLDNLGYSRIKQKKYAQAFKLFQKTATIRDSLNINDGKNYNRLYLSEYYSAQRDTINASRYAYESLNLSKSFRAPGDMLLALKQLIIIEPKNALKHAKDYMRISDSMHKLERDTRNKFAKIAYETKEITKEKDTAVKQSGIFFGIAVLVFVIGVMLFIIINQRAKQKKLQFLRQQQQSNEEIYQLIQTQHQKIEEGRLIEKKRIALELHDGVMNKLASTRFNLHLLTKNNDPETSVKCTPYIDGIHEIEKEIRNIAHDLNNDVFSENNSFKNTLLSFFEEQQKIIKANWHVEVQGEINWEALNATTKINIFRIFQELLHNINKHANAKNVIISCKIESRSLFLEVYDDGVGFSLNGKKKGIGLQNITTRVKACAGTIKILSDKGIGTKVIITIPQTDNKTV